MTKMIAIAALLTAAVAMASPWPADAQGRGGSVGSPSGGGIGGGTIGGGSPSGSFGNRSTITRAAPVPRSSPALPPSNPVSTPRYDMNRYYNNDIGRLPPGARATTMKPR